VVFGSFVDLCPAISFIFMLCIFLWIEDPLKHSFLNGMSCGLILLAFLWRLFICFGFGVEALDMFQRPVACLLLFASNITPTFVVMWNFLHFTGILTFKTRNLLRACNPSALLFWRLISIGYFISWLVADDLYARSLGPSSWVALIPVKDSFFTTRRLRLKQKARAKRLLKKKTAFTVHGPVFATQDKKKQLRAAFKCFPLILVNLIFNSEIK